MSLALLIYFHQGNMGKALLIRFNAFGPRGLSWNVTFNGFRVFFPTSLCLISFPSHVNVAGISARTWSPSVRNEFSLGCVWYWPRTPKLVICWYVYQVARDSTSPGSLDCGLFYATLCIAEQSEVCTLIALLHLWSLGINTANITGWHS